MENDEQNLGSQEPTTSTNGSTKTFNFIPVVIIAVAVIAVIAIIFGVMSRSPKATVKDFLKSMEKGNFKKFSSTIDIAGIQAFSKCGEDELDEFDDTYKDIVEDLDDDDIEEFNDSMEKMFDSMADDIENENISFKIKDVKTSKVDGSKKLTKVKAKIETNVDGEKEVETITFYTVKKGLKNYIVDLGDLM